LIDLLKQQAKEIADANIAGYGNTMTEAANRLEQLVLPTPKDLADKAAIFLEENNISGDAMIELDHNITEEMKGSLYLHDIMAEFARKFS
jgi:hypothetical protein